MAKSAAEERRELSEAVATLRERVAALTKSLDELRVDRDAKAAAFGVSQVEATRLWEKHDALAREFADYKRRAELREQRLWQLGIGLFLALIGVTATVTAAIIRRQP